MKQVAISQDALYPGKYRVHINHGGNIWNNPFIGSKENAKIIERAFLKVGFKKVTDINTKKFLRAERS